MKNVLRPLAERVFIPLGLTAASWAINAAIHMFGSDTTTLIISNEKINITKIVKSLEVSGLLIKEVSETIKNEAKEQKRGSLRMLLGTLAASLRGDLLTGKTKIKTSEGTFRAGQDF